MLLSSRKSRENAVFSTLHGISARTISACKLFIKRTSQNDLPTTIMQNVFINEHVENSFYNVHWCTMDTHVSPYCTTQHQLITDIFHNYLCTLDGHFRPMALKVLTPCDILTVFLRSTRRSGSTYCLPLLYDIATSPASYCNRYMTVTWFA